MLVNFIENPLAHGKFTEIWANSSQLLHGVIRFNDPRKEKQHHDQHQTASWGLSIYRNDSGNASGIHRIHDNSSLIQGKDPKRCTQKIHQKFIES
jgi:hypothetical protein